MVEPSSVSTRARRATARALKRYGPDVRGRNRLCRLIMGDTSRFTTVTFGPGITIDLDMTDADQKSAWYFQFVAPSLAPLLAAVLTEGDTFVDVGGNIGIYTCWAAKQVGTTGVVHSYEPMPSTSSILQQNINRNQLDAIVHVHRAAVGDRAEPVTLYDVPGHTGHTSSYPRSDASRAHVVPGVRLDDERLGQASLVKIDVEGYETHVLRGAREWLASTRPVIVAEVCDSLLERAGSTSAEFLSTAADYGYEAWEIAPRGIRRLTGTPSRDMNVVLLDPAHHRELAHRLAATRFPRDYST